MLHVPSLLPLSALGSLVIAALIVGLLPRLPWKKAVRWAFPVALLGTASAALASGLWIHRLSVPLDAPAATERFSVLLRISPLSAWWFLSLCVLLWMGIVLVKYYTPLVADQVRRFFLILLSGIGALSLAGCGHLLVAVVAWQLVSLPLTLASMQAQMAAPRARTLVSVYLADFFSFVLMALGVAFLFAQYQTLSYDLIFESLQAESQNSDILLYSGTALWLAGVLVRLGGLPFHIVVCDRMASGNFAVSGFSSVFLAFSAGAFVWGFAGEALRPTLDQWKDFLALLGLATVWAGSLGMLVRPQWRGLLAYALVAQAGWVVLMLASSGPMALEPESFFSLATTSIALLLLLFGVLVVERNGGKRTEDVVRSLVHKHGPLAFLLVSSLLTLACVPPTSGFAARAMLLSRLATDGLPWLAIAAGLSTVVAAYPCLVWVNRILQPGGAPMEWAFPAKRETALLWIFGAALWVLGIWPVIAWPG
jgi:NADH:ubiquinone oxidoreductase subunit 2 (subunit N)